MLTRDNPFFLIFPFDPPENIRKPKEPKLLKKTNILKNNKSF